MEIKTKNCIVIYKENAFLYYVFNDKLNAYFIYSVAADGNNNYKSKKALGELYKYFITKIVKDSTAYCRLFKGTWLTQFMEKDTIQYNNATVYKCKSWNKALEDSIGLQYLETQNIREEAHG